MAWSVDDIYQQILKIMRKNQAGSFSSTDLFYIWNSEQSAYFQDLKGRFQARNNGKGGINTGLIENETDLIKLSPFTKTTSLAIAAGLATRPTDFSYLLALRIGDQPVYHINKNQIATILDSEIDPPSITAECYYYTEYGSTYKFFPSTVTSVNMDYMAAPKNIVWAYTLDGNNRQVYDPVLSIQPEWLQEDIIEISNRTLKKLGVSFHDNAFTQYGESVINTGN